MKGLAAFKPRLPIFLHHQENGRTRLPRRPFERRAGLILKEGEMFDNII